MTSSGRCVKRRNLNERDGHSYRSNRTRKLRHGQKTSRKKCSTSKSLRPQRVAARNALTLFSKITGRHTDGEDEDGSEGEISGSESSLQDSNIESDGSDRENLQSKYLKGKQVLLDESEDTVKSHELHDFQRNSGNRRRLVLKLPKRPSNTNTLMDSESTIHKCENPVDLVDQSCRSEANENRRSSPGLEKCSMFERAVGGQSYKVENYLDLTENYKNGSIRWGGSRARTSKRLRVGEATSLDALPSTSVAVVGHTGKDYIESEKDCGKMPPQSESQRNGDTMDGVVIMNEGTIGASTSEGLNGKAKVKEHSGFSECKDFDQSPKSVHMAPWDASTSSYLDKDGSVFSSEQNEKVTPVSTKLRLRKISTGPESPCKQEMSSVPENLENGICNTLPESLSSMDHDPIVPEDDGTHHFNSDHRCSSSREADTQIDKNAIASVHEPTESHLNRNKMFSAVYRRVKSHRSRINLEGDSSGKGEGAGEGSSHISNTSDHNLIAALDCQGDSIDGARRTRSMGLKASTRDPSTIDHDLKLSQGHEPRYTFRSTQNSTMHKCQLQNEEWGSSSRTSVGLRSSRNRRSYYDHDMDPIDKRKSHQSTRKGTWLMLSAHEESSRYIPQLGDEVVYLRQVSIFIAPALFFFVLLLLLLIFLYYSWGGVFGFGMAVDCSNQLRMSYEDSFPLET